jgi:hypothetical protein
MAVILASVSVHSWVLASGELLGGVAEAMGSSALNNG